MSHTYPVSNSNSSIKKEFLNEHSKNFEIPTARWIKAFFHPTLRDHVITINEINFPRVKSDEVIAMFHNYQAKDFKKIIKNKLKGYNLKKFSEKK